MNRRSPQEPVLEQGDYIRYERGTAPLEFKSVRHRPDYKNKDKPREPVSSAKPAPKLTPIEIKQSRQEEREEAERLEKEKKQDDVPFILEFRPIEARDFNFILNSWLMSYRDSRRDHTNGNYFPGQQNLIAEISQRRTLIVGCDAESPEWIVGYICGQLLTDGRLLLDYIYVKHAYRERGIARGLLAAIGWTEGMEIVATHWTKPIDKVGKRYNAGHNAYFNTMGFSNV